MIYWAGWWLFRVHHHGHLKSFAVKGYQIRIKVRPAFAARTNLESGSETNQRFVQLAPNVGLLAKKVLEA